MVRFPYRWILWDLMATLIEPAEPIEETYARVALAHDIVVDPAQLLNRLRLSLANAEPLAYGGLPPRRRREMVERWWRRRVAAALGLAVGELPEPLFRALWQHFAQAAAWRLRPGAAEATTTCAGRIGQAILTNNDLRATEVVAGLGLPIPRERIFVSAELLAAKPERLAFEQALALLEAAPAEVLYVDEDPRMRAAAARVGLGVATLSALLDSLGAGGAVVDDRRS